MASTALAASGELSTAVRPRGTAGTAQSSTDLTLSQLLIPTCAAATIWAWALARGRWRIDPLVLTTTFWSPILVGYAVLDVTKGTHAWIAIAIAECTFVSGYAFALRASRLPPTPSSTTPSPTAVVAFKLLIVVVVTGAIFHLTASGIPVLQSNVEIQRFNFTSSGFGGVPGRLYLYGLPAIVIGSSVIDSRMASGTMRGFRRLAWASYAAVQILSGFKGGVLNILVLHFLTRALVHRPIKLNLSSITGYGAALIGAFAFAAVIASRYSTLGALNSRSAAGYLAARVSVLPALPGHYSITHLSDVPRSAPYLVTDLKYFLHKYFGIGDAGDYPLDKIVSSAMTGTPLSEESFVVPVTVGAAPGFFVDFGWGWTFALMALTGCAYAWVYRSVLRARTCLGVSIAGLAVYLMNVFVLNGSAVYVLLNFLLMVCLLGTAYFLSYLFSHIARGAIGLFDTSGVRRTA